MKPKFSRSGHPDSKKILKEEDIASDLFDKRGSFLFLGKYTLAEVKLILAKKNFFAEAKKRKLWPLVFSALPTESPQIQRIQIHHESAVPQRLVMDLKIRESRFFGGGKSGVPFPAGPFNLLVLEWLTLQNPMKSPLSDRGLLPGQNFPGLGLGWKALDLFITLGRLNGNDGILAFPAFFHNAVLFSKKFRFLDPLKEAEVQTIDRTFKDVPFRKLAWIIHLNCLSEEGKGPYLWEAEEQVYALHPLLKRYFHSAEYKRSVRRHMGKKTFLIDWERFEKKRKEEKIPLGKFPA